MTNYLKIIAFFISFQSFCCFGQSVTYNAENSFIANSAIKPLVPTITNGPLTGYSFKADLLPPGLYIDQSTGLIWGMPTVEAKETEYTVTAIKDTKTISAKFKVTVKPAAPSITYIIPNTFTVDTKIADIFPNNTGGTATYSVTPPLPDGLHLVPNTGAITGTPTKVAEEGEYTISATNETGTSQPPFKVKIAVKEADNTFSWGAVLCIIAVFSICLYILIFLFTSVSKAERNKKEALGLPSGSVRAIIAVLFIVFFMLLAVIFYFDADNNSHNTDLAKQILTILGTLVTAVSAFYFGSKATEQGHAIAAEAFKDANKRADDKHTTDDQNNSSLSQDEIIQLAITQNKALLTKPNVTAIMHGKFMKEGQIKDCITVHLSNSEKKGYPVIVTAVPTQGNPIKVDVDYITDIPTPKAFNGIVYGDGYAIANSKTSTAMGTICCRLYNKTRKEYYLLTCSHVMHAGYSSNDKGWLNTPLPTNPSGSWVWAMRTDDIDAALIKIDQNINFTYDDPSLQGNPPRVLTSNDMLATDIVMVGRADASNKPKIITGKITNFNSAFPIDIGYSDGDQPINNLIVLSQVVNNGDSSTYKTLSTPGDSGALVYDQANNPIGMVIAGNDQFTYAIPLGTILLNTQSQIA